MPTRNVNLTQHHDHFVEEQISTGKFKNASEVMRAGLRLLEQQTAEDAEKLAALRALAAQAFDELDRGQAVEIKGSTALEKHIAKLGRVASRPLA
jgi:antitoxin ParD1/3/4